MIGLAIGLVCGAGELFLLTRVTLAVQNGEPFKLVGYLFLKLVLLACAFTPVILFVRRDLLWCGVGISAALVLGAFALNLRRQRPRKGGKKS